jgi:hypothetical protein
MVEQPYVKQCSGLLHTLCQMLIGFTWLWRTRRMIMHQDKLRSKQFQRSLHYQAMIHDSSLHTALTYTLSLNDAI